MSLLPISAGAQALQFGAALGGAAFGAATGFAKRLGSALKPNGAPAAASVSNDSTTASTDLGALKETLGSLLKSFHGRLQSALARKGVVTTQEYQISQDPFGDLRLDGLHPQRREIEQTLAEDGQLQEMFSAIVAAAAAVQNAEGAAADDSRQCGIVMTPDHAAAAFTPSL